MPTAESPSDTPERIRRAPAELGESPRHGFQGDRAPAPPPSEVPASLTIALSREAGSRGSTIATRAGQKLGWQVYTQELLEYLAQEASFQQDILNQLSPLAMQWVDARLARLQQDLDLRNPPSLINLSKTVLGLGAQGAAVLVGRGAGYILPHDSTLFVRIVASTGRPDRLYEPMAAANRDGGRRTGPCPRSPARRFCCHALPAPGRHHSRLRPDPKFQPSRRGIVRGPHRSSRACKTCGIQGRAANGRLRTRHTAVRGGASPWNFRPH